MAIPLVAVSARGTESLLTLLEVAVNPSCLAARSFGDRVPGWAGQVTSDCLVAISIATVSVGGTQSLRARRRARAPRSTPGGGPLAARSHRVVVPPGTPHG